MGYYRSLYVGPVVRVDKCKVEFLSKNKNPVQKEYYEQFDHVAQSFAREDAFEFLQRHVGGDGLLAPRHLSAEFKKQFGRKLSVEIDTHCSNDQSYLIKPEQIEAEKQWLIDNHAKELEILRENYEVVEISWAVVIDGS